MLEGELYGAPSVAASRVPAANCLGQLKKGSSAEGFRCGVPEDSVWVPKRLCNPQEPLTVKHLHNSVICRDVRGPYEVIATIESRVPS